MWGNQLKLPVKKPIHFKPKKQITLTVPWTIAFILAFFLTLSCSSKQDFNLVSKGRFSYALASDQQLPDINQSSLWSDFNLQKGIERIPEGTQYIWIKTKLDQIPTNSDTLYISSCPLIAEVYQDDQLIETFGRRNGNSINTFDTTKRWPALPIKPSTVPSTLLFKIVSPPSNILYKGVCQNIAIGPKTEIYRYLINRQIGWLSGGLAHLTFSAIAFMFFLLVGMKTSLYLSLFCLFSFMLHASKSDLIWFALGLDWDPRIFWQISSIAAGSMFILFVDDIIPAPKNFSSKIAQLSFGWLLIYLTTILITPAIPITPMASISYAVLLIQIVAITINAALGFKYQKPHSRTFGFIVIIFAVSLLNNLSAETNFNQASFYNSLADLIFLLACTIVGIQEYKAKFIKNQEERNKLLEDFNQKLKNEVNEQTEQLRQRTDDLTASNRLLEENNQLLKSSYRKMEDIVQNKNTILAKIETISESNIRNLQNKIQMLEQNPAPEKISAIFNELHQLNEALLPLKKKYQDDIAVENKRIMLLEPDNKQRRIIKMALGGNALKIELAESLETAVSQLKKNKYDIVITNEKYLEDIEIIKKIQDSVNVVIMTSVKISSQIEQLISQDYVSNMIFRDESDYRFVTRNIATTITKIINSDYFGLDKYLNWGIDIREFPITSSQSRMEINKQIKKHLIEVGIKGSFINQAELVAEEMMMNAIYDAPINEYGEAIYNHLPRSEPVVLKEHEFAKLKLAFDGVLLAIAVEDPFGALERKTVLEYLKNCIDGLYDLNLKKERKGGGGIGLYQILSTADLVVINVKKSIRTEFIAIINVQSPSKKNNEIKSFHYFNA